MKSEVAIMMGSVREGATFLVLHAGTDRGCRIARDLLRAGCRVAVTSRRPVDLARILHGYPAERVLAIAAEESQLCQVISRVEGRWGEINAIIDAGSGSEEGSHDGAPLEAA
jgi:NAD(P)-dependent dehydrogenase (short-subunit alcohol dehydrogenase family)